MNGPAPQPFWLLARTDAGRTSVLTVGPDGNGEALPVFSFEEEARMFLHLGAPRDGWRVRQTTTGELVSILLGPCADVETVLLDPLPGLGGRAAAGLVGVPRKTFVNHQLYRGRHQIFSHEEPFRAVVRT